MCASYSPSRACLLSSECMSLSDVCAFFHPMCVHALLQCVCHFEHSMPVHGIFLIVCMSLNAMRIPIYSLPARRQTFRCTHIKPENRAQTRLRAAGGGVSQSREGTQLAALVLRHCKGRV